MSEGISIEKYRVSLLKRRVFFGDIEIKVRPKSFELLTLFLERPNEIISKEYMLSTIWDDVSVDEQVIFQSIKELRKAFSEIDAIKTFPRKGYSWVADISDIVINEELPTEEQQVHREDGPNKIQHKPLTNTAKVNKSKYTYTFLFVFTLIIIGWFFSRGENIQVAGASVDGSIVVLPLKEHIKDRDHKWIRIGAMDQLIQQIPPSNDYGVMQVDDVLEIMKRAQMPLEDFNAEDINQIFVVSGAELIIEAELTGSPGDYQLVYTLRRRQNIDRGVLLTSEVYDAIDQLAQIIAKNIGAPSPTAMTHRNNLANQLLAQALDKKISEDYLGTEQYLKSLLELEPLNLKAKRLLAEISVYLKKTAQITTIVNSVEALSSENNPLIMSDAGIREFGRLQFWQALNELQFGRIDNAQRTFDQAKVKATKVQDWLYLGYLAEAQGHLYRATKQYSLAKIQYNDAIHHHKIIKCPFGEVNNLLNLAEISFLQQDYQQAQNQTSKSLAIAHKRELSVLIDQAEAAKTKYAEITGQ